MSLQKILVGVATVLGSLASIDGAVAQPTPEDAAQAEMLFREGRALIKALQVAEACAKFAESHRLDPQIGTLLNLALCHEEVGKTASAWAEFNEVAERSRATPERVAFARQHAKLLETRLTQLRFRVDPPVPDVSVKLDGRALGMAALGSAIPLDPGEHVVEATAPGKLRWVDHVRLAPDPGTTDIVVSLASEPAPAPEPPAGEPPAAPTPRPARPAPSTAAPSAKRDLGIILSGVGVVGLGVGAAFGFAALSKKDESEHACPNGCPEPFFSQSRAAADESRTYAALSTMSFGAGASAVVAGVYFILASRSSSRPTQLTRVTPLLLGSAPGVGLSGEW
jgi:hypothetical protein